MDETDSLNICVIPHLGIFMNKIILWLYGHIKRIHFLNGLMVMGIGLLFYILALVSAGGGIFKYHHEVTIVEEISCNPHTQNCIVIGDINGREDRFIIFDEYSKDKTYYQNCSLIVYTWYCREELHVSPKKGYEEPYEMVRG